MIENTTKVITERPAFLRIGLFWFMVRPLTLSQIWEIGAIVEKMQDIEFNGQFIPTAKVLNLYGDMENCTDVAVKAVFRSRWKRFLLGWYIRKNITMAQYCKLMDYVLQGLQATFFLTSITSLKGIKQMTSPTNTVSQIAPGDLSEE